MKVKVRLSEKLHLTPGISIMLILMAWGAIVALLRYVNGIGAISNLNDTYSWAFWISFDLFCGVALGSGAFTMAAIVHIFDIERFKPLLRPTILTGFLGYVMVIVALLVDLGRPERIWHMMIYQNHHSVLFEIGICVMTYTTVLAIEFAPVLFEGLRLPKIAHNLHRIAIPFVILGVVLSTLHQSSLGGLLLIQGNSLHPLWWTPILPLLFFVSAITVGLGMIILESSLSSRVFHRGLETNLLSELAKYIPIGLGIYLLLKFGELAYFGELSYLFSSGGMSALFWLEIIVGAIVPIVLFTQSKIRNSANGLLIGSLFVVVGLMINRFNVSWFAVEHIRNLPLAPTFMTQTSYFPSFMEVSVSVGIVAAGVFAFTLAAKYLPLFEGEEETAVHEPAVAVPQLYSQAGD
ncbi:MAG: Ni/Fe-hydrogenase cytochrome b subunit [Candidatus Promineifilaceae bacterium]